LETGFSPSSFLRWQPPYQNAVEGLQQVAQQENALRILASSLLPKRVSVTARLRSLSVPDDHPIFSAMSSAATSGKRTLVIAVSIIIMLGGGLIPLSGYVFDQSAGKTALIEALASFAVAVSLLVWGLRRYSLKKNVSVK